MMGGRAAEEAVAIAARYGADLCDHASQPLTADRLAQADYVVAMTRNHLKVRQLLARLSEANWRLLQMPPDD